MKFVTVQRAEFRSCVKVEVAALGIRTDLIVRTVSVDEKQHYRRKRTSFTLQLKAPEARM